MGILEKFIQKKDAPQSAGHIGKPMLGLSISAGVVKATIWELQDHTIEIIGLGVKNYSESGKEAHPDYKTIAEKAADAIDLACQVAEVDVKQTIFGVPQSWIVEEELLPEYDELTTNLAKNLDLESVAYVSIPHALSYYLQYLHKTPPTAILIGSAREGAQIAYVENGKIKENTYVEWSGGNLGKNIDNGLIKFSAMTELPAIIFLYGYGDLSSAQADLMKYNWQSSERLGAEKKAPTSIVSPKIVVLEEHADSLAVALVGAKDYARHHSIHGRLEIKSLEYAALNTQMPVIAEHALPAVQEHITESSDGTSHRISSESEIPFGFILNQDIVDDNTSHINDEMHAQEEARENNQILANEPNESETEIPESENFNLTEPEHNTIQEPWEEKKPKNYNLNASSARSRLKISSKNLRQLIYISAIVFILIIVGGGASAWAYWNIPKAKVTVYVRADNLEKQLTLTASSSVTTTSNNTIPSQKISIELKDTRQASTSGKRTTGEVSKGTLTLINKTGAIKSFNSGTELRTSSNIKYTLSEGVTVASASAQTNSEGETKTYGKANVKAVAVEIGPEGNIEKDTSLAIAGYTKDDYEAISSDKFSGGSKKDIKVVSANDRTSLAKDLKADMQVKIPGLVREKVGADDVLLNNAWQIVSTTDKFNKSVNDEANTLSLETTIKIEGYTFKKVDVEKLLESVATTAVPDGFELKDNTKDVRTDFVSLAKDGTLTLNAVSRVNIIPKIDGEAIAKQILGKQEDAARKTILDNNKIYDVSFEYSMRVPEPLMTLPHKIENIKVERGIR